MIGIIHICITLGFLFFNETSNSNEVQVTQLTVHDDISDRALQVLQTKCNVCHLRQNPRKVFTRENMDSFVPKIRRQVFVKKRMPKGKKIKLTAEEYQILSTWITSIKHQ
jgi:uncharacterized membrane protein